jgi:hypothetical protein
MEWFKREWPNILTIGCLIIAAVIEAWEQALASSPNVTRSLPHLSGNWHYLPLALLVVAGVSWAIGRTLMPSRIQQQAALQSVTGMSVQPPVNFNANEYFRLAYHSDCTVDIEKRIRIAAHQSQPDNHEAFYAKFIGVGLIAYMHDIVWAYIFRSQILALMELVHKGGLMPIADAKAHYDLAAGESPQMYTGYSFDNWLKFLKSNSLVIQHPSNMLEITVRGKDYLKYSTHYGRFPDARKF